MSNITKFSNKRHLEIAYDIVKCYYINDKLHRKTGPCKIDKISLSWAKHGMYHRIDGPAYFVFDKDFIGKEWHLHINSKHYYCSEQTYWNT